MEAIFQSSCNFRSSSSSNHLANFQSSTFGYENFSKLPILHSSNPLAISQKLLTKTSQIFQSSTFGYAILQHIVSTLQSSTQHPVSNLQSSPQHTVSTLQSSTQHIVS